MRAADLFCRLRPGVKVVSDSAFCGLNHLAVVAVAIVVHGSQQPGGLCAVIRGARTGAEIRQTVILADAVFVVYLHSLRDSPPESLKD